MDTSFYADATAERLDQEVEVRSKRQRIITRKRNPVHVDLILDESVLRRVVGGSRPMADQLLHLADLPIDVNLAILPFTSGYPLGLAPGPFTVLEFDRATSEHPHMPTSG